MDPILIKRQHLQAALDAELTETQIGALTRALLCYQYDGILPDDMDPVTLAFWKFIHADMKREFGEGIR